MFSPVFTNKVDILTDNAGTFLSNDFSLIKKGITLEGLGHWSNKYSDK